MNANDSSFENIIHSNFDADDAPIHFHKVPSFRDSKSRSEDNFVFDGTTYELVRFYPNPQRIVECAARTLSVKILNQHSSRSCLCLDADVGTAAIPQII